MHCIKVRFEKLAELALVVPHSFFVDNYTVASIYFYMQSPD